MSNKPTLLWVGDAGVSTGFARATHRIMDTLLQTFNVFVLGINYIGEPHNYPFPIFPARNGGDAFGTNRIGKIAKAFSVDIIVIQNDVWNIPDYIEDLEKYKITCPVVGFLAVDGKNCQGYLLNSLSFAIFWTEFARQEAIVGGYTGPSTVIPLGVDLDIYKPINQTQARATWIIPPESKAQPNLDSFIALNVNRNQPRKRLDLTIMYFCDWIEKYSIKDAYLMLHAAPTGEAAYDLEQLMRYRNHLDRFMCISPHPGYGVSEQQLMMEYNLADIVISTTQGEGFGLTTFEAMACEKPVIVPKWSALEELTEGVAKQITCSTFAVTPDRINAIGGIPDHDEFIEALQELYERSYLRDKLGKAGRRHVEDPRYRWEHIGQQIESSLLGIIQPVGV